MFSAMPVVESQTGDTASSAAAGTRWELVDSVGLASLNNLLAETIAVSAHCTAAAAVLTESAAAAAHAESAAAVEQAGGAAVGCHDFDTEKDFVELG
jgi:hypothetical protein